MTARSMIVSAMFCAIVFFVHGCAASSWTDQTRQSGQSKRAEETPELQEPQEPEDEYFQIGNIEVVSKEHLWVPAKGLLSGRMVSKADDHSTVFRTICQHPDGDRLVCLQYPGVELFGTPYDISVFDRDLKAIKQGEITAQQSDTPFCIALIRSSDKQLPEFARNEWRLAVGFWRNHYQSTMQDGTPLARLAKGNGPSELTKASFGFYFDLPAWDGEEWEIGAGKIYDVEQMEIQWIESGVNLLVVAESDRERPGDYHLPRTVIEPRLAEWLMSSNEDQIGEALTMVIKGGIQSPQVRERVAEELQELLTSQHAWMRRGACQALLALHGKAAVSQIASLADDDDGSVRDDVTMALILSRDPLYLDSITAGCVRLADPAEGKAVVWALEQWKDPAVVPALIQFLENNERNYSSWWAQTITDKTYQRWGSAALQAHRVLLDLTGAAFPFDKDAAMKAWNEVRHLPPAQRTAALKQRFPDAYQRARLKLTANIVEDGTCLTIHNLSDVDAWLPRKPSGVSVGFIGDDRESWAGGDVADQPDKAMVRVPPRGSFTLTVSMNDHVPKPTDVILHYEETGKEHGVIAWQGRLEAKVER